MFKFSKLNQRGVSLAGVLAGAAISAVVVGGLVQGIVSMKNSEQRVFVQGMLDQMHLLAIQTVSNYKNSRTGQAPVLLLPQNIQDCLAGKGTSCATSPSDVPMTNAADLTGGLDLNSNHCTTDCPVVRNSSYRVHCSSSTRCDYVEFKVRTEFKGNKKIFGNMVDRESKIRIAGTSISGQNKIDFSCVAQGGMLIGIDYEHQKAQCGGIPATGVSACSSGAPNYESPIIKFGMVSGSSACAKPAGYLPAVSGCGGGVGSASLFAVQSACSGSNVNLVVAGSTTIQNPAPAPQAAQLASSISGNLNLPPRPVGDCYNGGQWVSGSGGTGTWSWNAGCPYGFIGVHYQEQDRICVDGQTHDISSVREVSNTCVRPTPTPSPSPNNNTPGGIGNGNS